MRHSALEFIDSEHRKFHRVEREPEQPDAVPPIEGILIIAEAKLQAELNLIREELASTKEELASYKTHSVSAKGRAQTRDRGASELTQNTIAAAIALFVDRFGKTDFPASNHALARAIVDKAKELNLTVSSSPDPARSGTVKAVADAGMLAVRRMEQQ